MHQRATKGFLCCRLGFFTVKIFLTFSAEPISGKASLTFLITLDRDLGELMLLKLRWEGEGLWNNVWNRVKNMIPWGGAENRLLLTVGKISIKAGETQER